MTYGELSLYNSILFSHCVSFALLIIDFIVILHARLNLIRVLLKINQSINRFLHCIRSPKWGLGDLGVGTKTFGGKLHPSLESRVFRHLWSRYSASCSSVLYGYRYSHLP